MDMVSSVDAGLVIHLTAACLAIARAEMKV
jgi:hypothetical protein